MMSDTDNINILYHTYMYSYVFIVPIQYVKIASI